MKIRILAFLLTLLVMPLVTGSDMGPDQGGIFPQRVPLLDRPANHLELEKLFSQHNYEWTTLQEGVPTLFLEALPEDLDLIPHPAKKKSVFFLSLLPVVLRANEEIRAQKRLLSDLFEKHDQGETLTTIERIRVEAIAGEYKIAENPLENLQARSDLLKRVDTLPISLVLAQAATESGYGTSRFARLGNNLFGEYTFTPGTGIVPSRRLEGRTHEIRNFASLYDSVASYMKNLNTHRAYQPLRELRAQMRAEGRPLHGVELATGLTKYSERGESYVRQIQTMIRNNQLHRVASATLRSTLEDELPLAGLLSTGRYSSRRLALRENP